MKPILIDALTINMGGALTVLNRLIDGLTKAKTDYVLIKDARCPKLNSELGAREVVVMQPSFLERHRYYCTHKKEFHSVLCMANVPPTIKMPCRVHTYFHNLSLLMKQDDMPVSWKVKNWLKRMFITSFAKNTDSWVVQTSNTETLIKETLPWKGKTFFRYPIYTIPETFNAKGDEVRSDYIFVGNYTFAKGHDELLEAWKLLHRDGLDIPLHLTVWNHPQYIEKVNVAIAKGVRIVNHGKVPFEQLGKLYKKSKAVIYPSLNESLGLGIVEGLYAGCDIISSNLPFTHAICKPSEVFEPYSAKSIVEAVKRYEQGKSKRSELTIHDCIPELLELICV